MSADAWLHRVDARRSDAVQLVLLPHAGGSASYFNALASKLAADFDVVLVQYPGRQERRREPAMPTIAALADGVFNALGMPDRPTILFGHSMGAVVAFETTVRMERAGATGLLGMIASGRRGPAVLKHEDVHLRGDAGLIAEIRALSGTHADIFDNKEIVQMILPALRADYRAVETYRMSVGTRIRTPVSILIGDSDPRVSVADAQAWSDITDGGSQLRVFPGGHFYLDQQHEQVATAIRESADEFRSLTGIAGRQASAEPRQ